MKWRNFEGIIVVYQVDLGALAAYYTDPSFWSKILQEVNDALLD